MEGGFLLRDTWFYFFPKKILGDRINVLALTLQDKKKRELLSELSKSLTLVDLSTWFPDDMSTC